MSRKNNLLESHRKQYIDTAYSKNSEGYRGQLYQDLSQRGLQQEPLKNIPSFKESAYAISI